MIFSILLFCHVLRWISYEHYSEGVITDYYVVIGSDGNIIHGPIKVDSDMDFYVCDRDNFIWTERGGYVYLYDNEFKEYKFNATNFIIPNQKLDDKFARVDYYEYCIFDRWNNVEFSLINDLEFDSNTMQLFNLPINEDVSISDIKLKVNNNEVVNIQGTFPSFYNTEFSGFEPNTNNIFSISQQSLLGGKLLLTFPLEYNTPTVILNSKSNNSFLSDMKVYPIPVIDYLIMSIPKEERGIASIQLIDINGHAIFKDKIQLEDYEQYKIDFRGYDTGIYIVTVMQNGNIKTIKVVK